MNMINLVYKLDIPQEHESLIQLIFSKRDIINILEQVNMVLPGSNELLELVIELRNMEGVAYTTGSIHKKHIILSSAYFIKVERDLLELEIHGVLCHELVHTVQYNGFGTADAGLIEGIADYGI